jgi:D-glycero-D-manno-heptose 1,7-bisphosphate phosphatase
MMLVSQVQSSISAETLIIFDRDNTLSLDLGPMNGKSDCIILPKVIEGLKLLTEISPILAIATNQSYVGRGQITLQEVEEFHQKLLKILQGNGISVNLIGICPHAPWENCLCRKPKPGLLNELIKTSNVQDRNRIFFVGDKESDMEAAKNAGIQGLKSDQSNFLSLCESIKSQLSGG